MTDSEKIDYLVRNLEGGRPAAFADRTGQDRIGMPRPYVSYIRNGEVIDIIVESYVEMCNKDVQ